ncbi:MAG: bifunctional phosphoribosyl-AMP cyclohydrolase/phosphoribosyl-ATP diphosphatase HisIE [Eubacteriales bacterium]
MKELNDFFKKGELIPAVIQDANTKSVLMLAYMNETSLRKTIESGTTWFFSRSRQCLWNKGANSGNLQYVKSIQYDCDDDTLLIKVTQVGVACHTGEYSCFHNKLLGEADVADTSVLNDLYKAVADRKTNPQEGSYTCYLFDKGIDKILKKVGEECSETIIAAKNNDNEQLTLEISDLLYHLIVLMNERNLPFDEVLAELDLRSKKIGNLKKPNIVDKNT